MKKTNKVDIDKVDRKIISLLQENGRRSNVDIARYIDISESTVKNRIDRLIEKKILSVLAVLNPQAMGYESHVIIGISTEKGQTVRVGNTIKSMKEVAYLGYVTGRYDMIVEVLLKDPSELFSFLSRKIEEIPGIAATETFYVLQSEKINYEWKLPESNWK